jgi:hypothetical protein
VPNGNYTVRLHFAENYQPLFQVGQRVFDVNIQGALVFDNIDVFAEVGARTALIKTATATVTNGTLSITSCIRSRIRSSTQSRSSVNRP